LTSDQILGTRFLCCIKNLFVQIHTVPYRYQYEFYRYSDIQQISQLQTIHLYWIKILIPHDKHQPKGMQPLQCVCQIEQNIHFCNKRPCSIKYCAVYGPRIGIKKEAQIIHLAITWLVQLRTNTTTAFETLGVYALAYNIWYFLQPPRAVNCCLFIANTCCKEVRIVTFFLIFVASAPSFFRFYKNETSGLKLYSSFETNLSFLCFLMLW
jgi:hypothetical protein